MCSYEFTGHVSATQTPKVRKGEKINGNDFKMSV